MRTAAWIWSRAAAVIYAGCCVHALPPVRYVVLCSLLCVCVYAHASFVGNFNEIVLFMSDGCCVVLWCIVKEHTSVIYIHTKTWRYTKISCRGKKPRRRKRERDHVRCSRELGDAALFLGKLAIEWSGALRENSDITNNQRKKIEFNSLMNARSVADLGIFCGNSHSSWLAYATFLEYSNACWLKIPGMTLRHIIMRFKKTLHWIVHFQHYINLTSSRSCAHNYQSLKAVSCLVSPLNN